MLISSAAGSPCSPIHLTPSETSVSCQTSDFPCSVLSTPLLGTGLISSSIHNCGTSICSPGSIAGSHPAPIINTGYHQLGKPSCELTKQALQCPHPYRLPFCHRAAEAGQVHPRERKGTGQGQRFPAVAIKGKSLTWPRGHDKEEGQGSSTELYLES